MADLQLQGYLRFCPTCQCPAQLGAGTGQSTSVVAGPDGTVWITPHHEDCPKRKLGLGTREDHTVTVTVEHADPALIALLTGEPL